MADNVDVSVPHGVEQNIKMEILAMIHSGESPYLIIDHVARYLEEASAEPGYANHIRENMRAVYGCALLQKRLLTDELADVEERLKKIEKAQAEGDFTDEEKTRIGFAIGLHQKNIQRLKGLIDLSEQDGTDPYIEK
ncbi:MAG: hypothetical protein Q4D07_05430 [Selenomonadaceae bacterium]|nr:hypothetical protein [Selenomonadaceae bacterium]